MSNSSDILKKHMEAIKTELVAKYDELGMRASGEWEQSLEVKVSGLSGIITGSHYTEQLVNGREPGKFPPIKAIRQWILEKPIHFVGKIKLSSLAFLIARKIANDGTKYYQQGGTDLIESVITPERIQQIIDDVSFFQVNEFTSEVTGFLEQLKTAS